MEFRVSGWVVGDLKQRQEDVRQQLLEVLHHIVAAEDIVETRDLDQPAHVVAVDVVCCSPTSQLVPLIFRLAVDA